MTKYNNASHPAWISLVLLIIISLSAIVGCAPRQSLATKQISKQDLRDQLDSFTDYAKTTLGSAINQVDQMAATKHASMISLQFRIKALQGLNAMLEHDDAVVAFINTWAYCVRMRMFIQEGHGANLYKENQGIMVDAITKIESKIAETGKLFLTDEQYRTTEQKIREFAAQNPIQSNYSNIIVFPTEQKGESFQALNAIISIPMAPFTAIQGVDRTATAVNRFTDTAGRFSDVVADMPELTRWQLLLLYYELEESDTISSLVTSTQKISESSARLAEAADTLPGELKTLVEDIDSKQANLRTTLDKIEDVSVSLDTAAKSIVGTAQAWEKAADATAGVFKEYGQLKSEPKDPSAKPTSIQDIQVTIDKAAAAAAELRVAAAELNQLAKSDMVSKTTWIIVWRIVQLVALIMAIRLIYKIALRKFAPPKSEKTK